MELVSVVAILAVLAVFAANRVSSFLSRAKETAAGRELVLVREAFLSADGGYVGDMRGIPGFSLSYLRMANLLVSTNLYGEVIDGTSRMRGLRVDGLRPDIAGLAPREEFVSWSEERSRGWRGPYLKSFSGVFPSRDARRFGGDATFAERGFFPEVRGLRLPEDFSIEDVSVYGFPGEAALLDPWGNPYVLQIPPAQAFSSVTATNIPDAVRFRYARVVSAGPDGILSTPCFSVNFTNDWREIGVNWMDPRHRLVSRQAGLVDGDDRSLRGDDIVLFLNRNDIDEGDEP